MTLVYQPVLNAASRSASLKLRSSSDRATSAYCCTTGVLGLNNVPKASKQISVFLAAILRSGSITPLPSHVSSFEALTMNTEPHTQSSRSSMQLSEL